MNPMAEFLRNVTLPTMPEVAHELIRSLNNDDAPLSQVRNAIAKDPALAVKLLRLANSARYGASRSVSSIDDAIALVGAGQVRTLALASCLNNAFPVMPGLDRDRFWHTSQTCGGYAQWLANRIGAEELSLAQLKILQEAITLTIIVPFVLFYMGQPLKLDFLWAGLCLLGAVYFIFRS